MKSVDYYYNLLGEAKGKIAHLQAENKALKLKLETRNCVINSLSKKINNLLQPPTEPKDN